MDILIQALTYINLNAILAIIAATAGDAANLLI